MKSCKIFNVSNIALLNNYEILLKSAKKIYEKFSKILD